MSKVYRFVLLIPFVSAIIAEAAEKRALLIGISDYPTVKGHPELEWSDIHGANGVVKLAPTMSCGSKSVNDQYIML